MEDILPLLQPAGWELEAKMVCRPLAQLGAVRKLPLVAYGWDRPKTFDMLGKDHPAAAPAEQLDAPALENLRARPATWELVAIKVGWFKKVRYLICVDDFLAAERILDAAFLTAAQRQLGAKLLAVGIPRRGMLMVCDGADRQTLRRFNAAVAGQYYRAESPPITTTIFAAVDGKLIGHLDDDDDVTDEQVEHEEDEDADTDRDGVYVQTLTLDAPGGRRAVICAGGEPLELLEARIRDELSAMVDKYGASLEAEVQIIPDLNARSAALDTWMPALASRLSVPVKYGDLG
ncbi:MAG TPA: hypothetical protein VLT45_24835 [Kofleriaceae bacterium]|nr:hypothetical protein [Kofleriaceae bacterium]